MGRLVAAVLGVVGVLAGGASPALAARYTVTDLGVLRPLPGLTSMGLAVNRFGHVAGASDNGSPFGSRAVLWIDGRPINLGGLTRRQAVATALTGDDRVVGFSDLAGFKSHAFLWEDGVMHDLGTLPGGKRSSAHGITADGRVVGTSEAENGLFHAVVWKDGRIRDLHPESYFESFANAISGNTIAGSAITDSPPIERHAAIWRHGFHDLGDLGGGEAAAFAVNCRGQVVGFSFTAGGGRHAFLWEHGVMRSLPSPGHDTFANDIADSGVIVGWFRLHQSTFASVWYPNGRVHDLNALIPPGSGWVLAQALGVSSAGDITGIGIHDGQTHAFLLRRLRAPR